MTNVRKKVRKLESKRTTELEEILAAELGEVYEREVPDSLQNDFMRASYARISPDEEPQVRVRDASDYDSSWSTTKQLAVALRMLLAERVGRHRWDSVTTIDERLLAELIVAIRESDAERERRRRSDAGEDGSASDEPLPLEAVSRRELDRWVAARRRSFRLDHGIYVLDCTPPANHRLDASVTDFIDRVQARAQERRPFDKIERAAITAAQKRRVYYVGVTNDVPKQVWQHRLGASAGGARFTNLFVPTALVDVRWCRTRKAARAHESEIAAELAADPDTFVYWS